MWKKTQWFIVYFGQEINKMMQLWFMRFMWYEFSICFFFLFHAYPIMFYSSLIIISSWMFLSKKGRIQFIALPWKSIHPQCVFFCLKRIHWLCPFQLLNGLSTPYYFNLTAKPPAYLASRNTLRLLFNYPAHVVLHPIQPRKFSHSLNYLFHIYLLA